MERFTTLDIYLAAYLQMNGCPLELENRNGKVLFAFRQGSELNNLIEQFNANSLTGVVDYTTAIKALRGRMIEARRSLQ